MYQCVEPMLTMEPPPDCVIWRRALCVKKEGGLGVDRHYGIKRLFVRFISGMCGKTPGVVDQAIQTAQFIPRFVHYPEERSADKRSPE